MSKKCVRTVLVGCGGICHAWLNAIRDERQVEIVGLVDLKPANMKQVAEEFDLDVPQSTELKGMLDEVQPDAVFDCTIPEAHCDVTLTALRHGCHVLGEKPLADSMANARRMVKAGQKAGKIYAVIQNRRYMATIRSLQRFLASGRIGRVTTANADFYIGAHFGGFRDRMKHVLLLDMAIHSFDQGRLITGADPQAVYCHEWNPAGSWYDHDASAHCIFEMTDDVVFNYRGSWCAEGLNTSWHCDWRIIGERGSVTWDGADTFHAEYVRKTDGFMSSMRQVKVPIKCAQKKDGGHGGVIREFLAAVRLGKTPETICTDNIKSLAMVFGAIKSAEQRRRVKITV